MALILSRERKRHNYCSEIWFALGLEKWCQVAHGCTIWQRLLTSKYCFGRKKNTQQNTLHLHYSRAVCFVFGNGAISPLVKGTLKIRKLYISTEHFQRYQGIDQGAWRQSLSLPPWRPVIRRNQLSPHSLLKTTCPMGPIFVYSVAQKSGFESR